MFHPVLVEKDNPVQWVPDETKSVIHDDGFAHFVWVQNLPAEEIEDIDGQPDYAELYEQLNQLDVLNSVHVRGTTLNLDPTMLLKIHPDELGDAVVQKGSDHALALGPRGDARYMTIGSDVVNAGHAAIQSQRAEILETAECVIPDPNTIAAAGTSSIALKMVYAPMLGKSDILREQYGEAIIRLVGQMLRTARMLLPDLDATTDEERYLHEVKISEDGEPVLDENGEVELEPVAYYVALPPRMEKTEVIADDGTPTGEFEVTVPSVTPGKAVLNSCGPTTSRKPPLTSSKRLARCPRQLVESPSCPNRLPSPSTRTSLVPTPRRSSLTSAPNSRKNASWRQVCSRPSVAKSTTSRTYPLALNLMNRTPPKTKPLPR